jgi:hypothetical protein
VLEVGGCRRWEDVGGEGVGGDGCKMGG